MTTKRSTRVALRQVAIAAFIGAATSASAQKAFFEDFESLPLGPNVEEALAGAKVWTHTPPAGWVQDDSKMPGFGNPANNGVTEWSGWSFANRAWWVAAAGDQKRSDFTFGSGTVLIADNDEWDDATHAQGFWDATITTPEIDVSSYAANSLVLAFDSSWRPEATDDGLPNFPVGPDGERINNQTGNVIASYDGAAGAEVLRFESTRTLADGSDNPFFHEDKVKTDPANPDEVSNTNEPVIVPLNNPANAKKLKITFGSSLAANDWWWAVDNIAVGVPPLVTGVSGNGVSLRARISEALNKNVDESKPITITVDGVAKAPVTVTRDGSLVYVAYSQAPLVYVPGSKHDVAVKFSTSDNRQVTDTGSFIAPSYTTLTTTPATLTATVKSPTFFTVDTAKGATLKLDGVTVTPTSVTPFTDPVAGLTVKYALPSALPPNSSHVLTVTFTTDGNQQVSDPVTFTASDYKTVSADLGTAVGTGSQAGMKWKTHQLEAGRANTIALAEQQLLGQLGASVHDTSGQVAGGYFEVPYVNFEESGNPAGIFSSNGEGDLAVSDDPIPGIPGTTGSKDNIAGEALTYLEIPTPGIYTMVVRSDDGFQVSVGNLTNPTFQVLGNFDAGRGDGPTEFYFQVTKAGVYLFRLLWFEGTGGASVEWFTINPNGTSALVGGNQPGSLKAFRVRTVAEPPINNVPATISVPPTGLTIQEGGSGTLSVTAIGNAPLAYQWFRGVGAGATAINGATTDKLTLNNAKATDAGTYSVTVSNSLGTNTSAGVEVKVALNSRSKVLLKEDFEGLALGPNVEEGIATGSGGALPNVWTKTPPAGWSIDDTAVPGHGTDNDGVKEWAGWSFAKREWWASTAGDQTRTQFTKGVGAIAVVDGDEWDDLPHAAGSMTSYLTTKTIDVSGLLANSMVLKFDSSWRPESPQKANITVKFDGGAPIEILRWTADAGPTFHADNQNESVSLAINNPANASTMTITFGYLDAGNNWWWAFDNVELTAEPGATGGVVLSAARTGDDLTVTWTGGTGPFLVQTSAALGSPWLDTATTAARTITVPIIDGAGFIRVIDGTAKNIQLFKAHLDSQQEPNKPASPAKGAGIAVIDGLNLTYYLSYEGLTTGLTLAHIHNGVVGVAGPVFVTFSPVVGSTSGIISGTATLTQAQKDFITSGNSYFNIHTTSNGGGEIRGQLAP